MELLAEALKFTIYNKISVVSKKCAVTYFCSYLAFKTISFSFIRIFSKFILAKQKILQSEILVACNSKCYRVCMWSPQESFKLFDSANQRAKNHHYQQIAKFITSFLPKFLLSLFQYGKLISSCYS